MCAHIRGDRLSLAYTPPRALVNMNFLYLDPYICTSCDCTLLHLFSRCITLNHIYLFGISPPHLPPLFFLEPPFFICNLFSLFFTFFSSPTLTCYLFHFSLLYYFQSLPSQPCYSLFLFSISSRLLPPLPPSSSLSSSLSLPVFLTSQ